MAFSCGRPARVRGLAIGFILLAVILIVAIGIAITIGARSKASSQDGAKALASAVIQQGANLRLATDRMVGDGVVKTAAFITLDTDAHTGLYNPAFGYLPQQLPPAAAFTGSSAQSQWQLISRKSGSYPNIYAQATPGINGMTSSSTYVILPYLTLSVCSAINYALYTQSVRHIWGPVYKSYVPLSTWQNGMTTNLPGLEACVHFRYTSRLSLLQSGGGLFPGDVGALTATLAHNVEAVCIPPVTAALTRAEKSGQRLECFRYTAITQRGGEWRSSQVFQQPSAIRR